MDIAVVESRLRQILRDVSHDHQPVGLDDELSQAGIDSLATIEAVTRIESEFEITFSEADISHANFASIRAMIALLDRHQQ